MEIETAKKNMHLRNQKEKSFKPKAGELFEAYFNEEEHKQTDGENPSKIETELNEKHISQRNVTVKILDLPNFDNKKRKPKSARIYFERFLIILMEDSIV